MSEATPKAILVIDDDDNFRRRLSRAFRDREHSVFEAANSKEAHSHIINEKVSHIVLDLKLGHESGLTLLKEISKLCAAKVLVLTGYGTITTAVEAVKLGAVDYLTKPVNADTVLAAFETPTSNSDSEIETPPLAQVEWDHIQRVIKDHDGNISRASKALGMHRRSLQRKLAKHPIKLR